MENIYSSIWRYLKENRRVVLARIFRQVGSAPRTVGTGCLITEDGAIAGTIGGGRLEFEVLERAKTIFKDGRSAIMAYRMTGDEVDETEMLCGGAVDIYLEPLFPENENVSKVFNALATIIQQGRAGILISRISENTDWNDSAGRLLIGPEGDAVGELADLPTDIKHQISRFEETRQVELVQSITDDFTVFVEPIRTDDVVYLFGAGHVSRYVASLAEMVGFSVVVIDDREAFANGSRFPQAKQIIVAPFGAAFDQIHINRSSYAVIVTRGHVHDRDVLKQVLDYPAAYIGMIGSRRKIKLIYESLMTAGITKDQLDLVHSPIGLSIGAQTPEEIAVSIVAELIHVRASLIDIDKGKRGRDSES